MCCEVDDICPVWTEEDWNLAGRQITWLCTLGIWDYTTVSQFQLDQAVLHWMTHLLTDRHDAVFALILALTMNANNLSIESVVLFSDKHPAVLPFRAEHCDRFDTRVGPAADYLSRLFRGTIISQLQNAEQEETSGQALLSKLHTSLRHN